jgi:hypothetical protein
MKVAAGHNLTAGNQHRLARDPSNRMDDIAVKREA